MSWNSDKIVICCDVGLWRLPLCRAYQMMTQRKNSTLFIYYCIFEFFETRGICCKKWKNCAWKLVFCCLQFGVFQAIFVMSQHVTRWCCSYKILRCHDIWHFQLIISRLIILVMMMTILSTLVMWMEEQLLLMTPMKEILKIFLACTSILESCSCRTLKKENTNMLLVRWHMNFHILIFDSILALCIEVSLTVLMEVVSFLFIRVFSCSDYWILCWMWQSTENWSCKSVPWIFQNICSIKFFFIKTFRSNF